MPCSKTLGYRLREARDKKIGGYRLEKGGKGRDGVVYRLVVDDSIAAESATAPITTAGGAPQAQSSATESENDIPF